MSAHLLSKRTLAFVVAVTGFAASEGYPQAYPNRPIRCVVPFAAGSTTDIMARTVSQHLSERWGQQVLVDNRPGAGGNIGSDVVAKAVPDGYTILVSAASTLAINASLYKIMPYDTATAFAPISRIAMVTNILVVHPSLPVKTVKELIALAKQRPGQLNFASGGSGGTQHLSGELFKTLAGVDMQHIPYKGSSAAMPDLLGGYVSLIFDGLPQSLPYIKAGRLRPIAVTTAKRSPVLPQTPTIAESGLSGYEAVAWFGAVAPAKTPRDIVTRLNGEIVSILNAPEVKSRMAAQGADAAPTTPEEFAAFIKSEMAKWAKVIKATGATAD